nr:hypothetical protein [Rhodovulum imhoffii]
MNPVLTEELEVDEDGRDIDREWIGLELNPFDDQALEQAVLLKEATGAKVTALAAEAEGGERLLKTALARGVDEVLLIEVGEENVQLSSRARAPLFQEALEGLAPDLVLTGVLSTDDIYGELAPQLGALLDWPQVSAVSNVALGDGVATLQQEYSGGISARIEVQLPAVVGLQAATQPPRYVAGSKLRDLLKVEVPTVEPGADFGADLADATELEVPDTSGGAEMLTGDAEAVAARIHEILVERGLV